MKKTKKEAEEAFEKEYDEAIERGRFEAIMLLMAALISSTFLWLIMELI